MQPILDYARISIPTSSTFYFPTELQLNYNRIPFPTAPFFPPNYNSITTGFPSPPIIIINTFAR